MRNPELAGLAPMFSADKSFGPSGGNEPMFALLIKLGLALVAVWVVLTGLFLLSCRSSAMAEGANRDL
jgi:hypothetical protein